MVNRSPFVRCGAGGRPQHGDSSRHRKGSGETVVTLRVCIAGRLRSRRRMAVRSRGISGNHEEPAAMNAPAISARRMLAEELARADAALNRGRAALLVAKEEYPQLPVDLYLARLDQIAEEVKD